MKCHSNKSSYAAEKLVSWQRLSLSFPCTFSGAASHQSSSGQFSLRRNCWISCNSLASLLMAGLFICSRQLPCSTTSNGHDIGLSQRIVLPRALPAEGQRNERNSTGFGVLLQVLRNFLGFEGRSQWKVPKVTADWHLFGKVVWWFRRGKNGNKETGKYINANLDKINFE